MLKKNSKLRIFGGKKVRSYPMPSRKALGKEEEAKIIEAINYYKKRNMDPGYQGVFEEKYCKLFSKKMGGGYADAVATGTAAIFVALAALNLPKNSEVLVSPITDPGTISAIIMNNLIPRIVDTKKNSYNIDVEQAQKRVNKKTSCILVVHSLGQAAEIENIVSFSKTKNIKVLEDCSQAHGASIHGKKVGSFGDISAFSTMYRKASMTGGSGGVVFSKDLDLLRAATAHADRGKERWRKDFDDRDPSQYLFPALNFHSNEISCAIGIASLNRLEKTIVKRLKYISGVSKLLEKNSIFCRSYKYSKNDSPFIYPIIFERKNFKTNKIFFAKAVLAEGIDLNPHYKFLVSDWVWVKKYLSDNFEPKNAKQIRDKTFNLYLNEKYGQKEIQDTVSAICKVEKEFIKKN
tara:strand:+ start:409 stop:1626 length:1218 start_codon:yes stop_codon:yes gene_type:complete